MFAFLVSGNVGTALASGVASLLSVAVAIYAVRVATQQSRTAAERLRLDFFDRRFDTWESINAAAIGRMDYLSAAPPDAVASGEQNAKTFIVEFQAAKRRAQFLFGPDVMAQVKEIEDAMGRFMIARVEADHVKDAAPERRAAMLSAVPSAYIAVMNQQEVLMHLVRPYLDLSHVAVMRPMRGKR